MNLMEIQPAELTLGDDSISFSIPFTKVDAKNRTVEGFATLDNIDNVKDVVDRDASIEAFGAWPGNIREMHQKIAVGKALMATPRQFTDKDGKTYDGIWVKARVSTGAEDTWQKVLDGTLTGFSVGGSILETKREFTKGDGQPVRRITKYRLNELSLVDAPCNSLATFSLIKDLTATDILDDGELEVEKVDYDVKTPISKFLPKKIRKRESQAGNALGAIKSQEHVDYASHLVNDAKDPYALRAHIIHSTNSLGLRLPAGWDNSEGIANMKKSLKEDKKLLKDADGDNDNDAGGLDEPQSMDDMTESDHVAAAQNHLKYAAHKASDRGDHAAASQLHSHAHNMDYEKQKAMIAQIKSMGKSIEDMTLEDLEKALLSSTTHKVAEEVTKSDDLSDNEKTAKNEDENLLQKFLAIVKGSELEKSNPSQDDTKSKEDIESEMDKEELQKALAGFGEDLNKTLKKKLGGILEEMEKSSKASEDALTALKDELSAKIEEISNRVNTLETSGALKKSAEGDGGEPMEKSDGGSKDTGLWADSIVPSIIKERFSGLR